MNSISLCRLLCGAACLAAAWAQAITPVEAERALAEGARITFIDIRPTTVFKEGHIPNAINIPAPLVPRKDLPPLGSVIVYDDGLGADAATTAAEALNQKTGIAAQVLQGGFAAWENARSATTRGAGQTPEALPMITYDKLKKTPADNLVLVDLRGNSPVAQKLTAGAQSDLASEFPGVRVTKSPFQVPAARVRVSSAAETPLLVLIDNGDGAARNLARTLKANGIKRFAILAGGDEMIKRQGQSGLDRIGSTVSLRPGISNSVLKAIK